MTTSKTEDSEQLKRELIIELTNHYIEEYRYDYPNKSQEELFAFARDIATEEVEALIASQVTAAERRGEVSALTVQKTWAELHSFTSENLYGGICHALDSIEQFPDQPLTSQTLKDIASHHPTQEEKL